MMIPNSIRSNIIKEFIDNKITVKKLEKIFNISGSTIGMILNNAGIEWRMKKLPSDEIITKYLNGIPVYLIGNDYGVSKTRIKTILNKHNIPLRSISESLKGKPPHNTGKKWPEEVIIKLILGAIGKHDGDKNPNWKGGISKDKKYRQTLQTPSKHWKQRLLKRDKVCKWCKSSERLEAHHIIPVRDIIDLHLLYDDNNGIILCRVCHKKVLRKENEYVEFFRKLISCSV